MYVRYVDDIRNNDKNLNERYRLWECTVASGSLQDPSTRTTSLQDKNKQPQHDKKPRLPVQNATKRQGTRSLGFRTIIPQGGSNRRTAA